MTYYEFDSDVLYRRLKPKMYLAILIIGLVIGIPGVIKGILFAGAYFLAAKENSEIDNIFLLGSVLHLLFFTPVLVGSIRVFRARARLRFTFRENEMDILVKKRNKKVTVPYSQITAVRANSLCYFIYTSRNLAYLLSREAMGNVSYEEFYDFILKSAGIKIIDFVERK